MSDYINREVLLDALRRLTLGETNVQRANMKITHYVCHMPAVNIVTCKKCKYNRANPRRWDDDDIIETFSFCDYIRQAPGGFCCFGKEDNNE